MTAFVAYFVLTPAFDNTCLGACPVPILPGNFSCLVFCPVAVSPVSGFLYFSQHSFANGMFA